MTDAADAEAICEAVTRPTKDQQALIMLHRARDFLIRQRRNVAMALRGHLAELGIVASKGMANTPQLTALMQSAGGIPELVQDVPEILHQQFLDLDAWIQVFESRIMKWHRSRETSRRLAEVPSIGPIIATVIIALVGDPLAFNQDGNSPPGSGWCPANIQVAAKSDCAESASEATRVISSDSCEALLIGPLTMHFE